MRIFTVIPGAIVARYDVIPANVMDFSDGRHTVYCFIKVFSFTECVNRPTIGEKNLIIYLTVIKCISDAY